MPKLRTPIQYAGDRSNIEDSGAPDGWTIWAVCEDDPDGDPRDWDEAEDLISSWLDDKWHFVTVVLYATHTSGLETSNLTSLFGVADLDEYPSDVALQLLPEALKDLNATIKALVAA